MHLRVLRARLLSVLPSRVGLHRLLLSDAGLHKPRPTTKISTPCALIAVARSLVLGSMLAPLATPGHSFAVWPVGLPRQDELVPVSDPVFAPSESSTIALKAGGLACEPAPHSTVLACRSPS